MMKTEEIIEQLSEYNYWRRGSDSRKQPNSQKIGKVIDEAIEKLKTTEIITDNGKVNLNLIKENEQLRSEIMRLKKQLSSIAKLEKERWGKAYQDIINKSKK